MCCLHTIFTTTKNNRTAIDINEISQFPEEEEVWILPLSTFRVVSITPPSDQTRRVEIYLEEIEADNSECINAV